jgi:hypothetical protein
MAAAPVPAVAVVLRMRRQEPAAPATSIDSAELGLPSMRVRPCSASIVRHGEFGGDAGMPQNPTA